MIPASLQQALTCFELAAQLHRASSITVWTGVGAVGVDKSAWAPSDSTARSFRLGTPAARNGSNSAFITPGMDSRRNNPGAPWLRHQPLKCIWCWWPCIHLGTFRILNHSAVEIRFQLLEPPGQAVTGEACAEKGKINLSHGR